MKIKTGIATIIFVLLAFLSNKNIAQLAGSYTIPGSYPSLAMAINDLNLVGVAGPVTININAGYTESVIPGGYTLTATGTAANPITFQKNGIGANPLLISYTTGIGNPGTAIQDGIFRIIGSDYITFDGLELRDTNTTNPKTMEFGFCFFKNNTTDGCQYNTVKNCVIKMRTINNPGGWYVSGSRGIEVSNTFSATQTATANTTSASGSNSYNKFYNNTIKECYTSISLLGFNDISPFSFMDTDNDIGGSSISTGNRILNFGGVGTGSLAGIQTYYQRNANISYNLINNNNGSGADHPGVTIKGIASGTAQSTNVSITNNTITLKDSYTLLINQTAIENIAGSTPLSNTVDITNNVITGCSTPLTNQINFRGIHNTANSDVLNINGNILTNNSSAALYNTFYSIYNTGTVVSAINISNNLISGITLSNTPSNFQLKVINSAVTSSICNLSISGNTLQSVTYNGVSNSDFTFISNAASPSITTISYNSLGTQTLSNLGKVYFIDNNAFAVPITNISYNTITGNIYNNQALLFAGCISNGSSIGSTLTLNNNNFSNFTGGSICSVYGIQILNTGMQFVRSNTVTNLSVADPLYGIYMPSGSTGSTIENNIIGNLNGVQVFGINFGSVISNGLDVKNNIVNSLTGSKEVNGIYSSGANSPDITKNKIYDLATSSSYYQVRGIYLGGNVNGTLNISNNLVGDLKRLAAANCNTCITGVDLQAYQPNTKIYFTHNTIYLDATPTGTNFSSFALNAVSSAGGGGDEMFFKNNIIINNSVPLGTGSVVAFQRSSFFNSNYNNSSNNNIFYTGSGPSHYIYSDGTNTYTTLAAFKTYISPAESNSKTELSPFTTTVGAMSNYLDINTSIPTLVESGGMAGTGINDDYAGNLRNPVSPDIGAWEGNYTIPLYLSKNFKDSENIELYPNPTSGELILKTEQKENLIFEIYNVIGQQILKQKITEAETKIDLKEQANGIYFVKVLEEGKTIYNLKIIKQ